MLYHPNIHRWRANDGSPSVAVFDGWAFVLSNPCSSITSEILDLVVQGFDAQPAPSLLRRPTFCTSSPPAAASA
jgi:hypothetical protein